MKTNNKFILYFSLFLLLNAGNLSKLAAQQWFNLGYSLSAYHTPYSTTPNFPFKGVDLEFEKVLGKKLTGIIGAAYSSGYSSLYYQEQKEQIISLEGGLNYYPFHAGKGLYIGTGVDMAGIFTTYDGWEGTITEGMLAPGLIGRVGYKAALGKRWAINVGYRLNMLVPLDDIGPVYLSGLNVKLGFKFGKNKFLDERKKTGSKGSSEYEKGGFYKAQLGNHMLFVDGAIGLWTGVGFEKAISRHWVYSINADFMYNKHSVEDHNNFNDLRISMYPALLYYPGSAFKGYFNGLVSGVNFGKGDPQTGESLTKAQPLSETFFGLRFGATKKFGSKFYGSIFAEADIVVPNKFKDNFFPLFKIGADFKFSASKN